MKPPQNTIETAFLGCDSFWISIVDILYWVPNIWHYLLPSLKLTLCTCKVVVGSWKMNFPAYFQGLLLLVLGRLSEL